MKIFCNNLSLIQTVSLNLIFVQIRLKPDHIQIVWTAMNYMKSDLSNRISRNPFQPDRSDRI